MRVKSLLTAAYLVLAPCVESVVHWRFQCKLALVVLTMHEGEPMRQCQQPRGLGLNPYILADISAMHDARHARERRVIQLVLAQNRFKAAAAIDVAQLDVGYIVRYRVVFSGDGIDPTGVDK